MTFEEIEKILSRAKELGLTELEHDGLKVKFGTAPVAPIAQATPPTEKEIESAYKPPSVLDDLTEEEILYYAVSHYDEIQRQKAEHKKKLEEEKHGGVNG